MQFSESWLRSFFDTKLNNEELAYMMTMGGVEVKCISSNLLPCSGVVVGKIISVRKHPNVDHLNIYQIDIGREGFVNIISDILNIPFGGLVPCALEGAELFFSKNTNKPFHVQKVELYGIESEGMLCTPRDLNISEHYGNPLILKDVSVGQDIRKCLDMDDAIFEVKLTPNKADCLSVMGLAREAAAITSSQFIPPIIKPVKPILDKKLPIQILEKDLCGRFCGRIITNIDANAEIPTWMVNRLINAGYRRHLALIDIVNYVMLTFGFPIDMFDLDKVSGQLEVRWAKTEEILKLVNAKEIKLTEDIGVIADNNCVVSIAGVAIGENAAVSINTNNIYISAAFWWPDAIRGKAKRYNLSNDSSIRFERGVDYEMVNESIELITSLLISICGGNSSSIDEHTILLPKRKDIKLRIARLKKILGIEICYEKICNILNRLNLGFSHNTDCFFVKVPSYRFDLEIEEDLIEEIARIYGYDKIPTRSLDIVSTYGLSEKKLGIHEIRHIIASRDYVETVNFSFVDVNYEHDLTGNSTPVRLLNPISNSLSVMRSTLLGGLINVLRFNLNRKVERVRIFEVGRVFYLQPSIQGGLSNVSGIAQPFRIGVLAYGSLDEEQWGQDTRLVDFFDVKGDLEALLTPRTVRFTKNVSHPALHPGKAASVWLDNIQIGFIGELHPRLQKKYELPFAPVIFEIDFDTASLRALPVFSEISRFPSVQRDIALIVSNNVSFQSVLDTFLIAASHPVCGIVKDIFLFDRYQPSRNNESGISIGEKSLAFRITLQGDNATLHDKDINLAIENLVDCVIKKHGARLRKKI